MEPVKSSLITYLIKIKGFLYLKMHQRLNIPRPKLTARSSSFLIFYNCILDTCENMKTLRALSHFAAPILVVFGFLQIILLLIVIQYYNMNSTSLKGSTNISNTHSLSQNSENTVIIYNRIPKTGSTSLMQIPYELCNRLKYNVLLLNITGGPRSYTMNLRDRMKFASNITGK